MGRLFCGFYSEKVAHHSATAAAQFSVSDRWPMCPWLEINWYPTPGASIHSRTDAIGITVSDSPANTPIFCGCKDFGGSMSNLVRSTLDFIPRMAAATPSTLISRLWSICLEITSRNPGLSSALKSCGIAARIKAFLFCSTRASALSRIIFLA